MFDDAYAFVANPSHTFMLGMDEASARRVRDALRGRPVKPAVAVSLAEIFAEWLGKP
jgi:hypothetical protein